MGAGTILFNSTCGDTGRPLLPRRRSLAPSLSTGFVSVLDTTQAHRCCSLVKQLIHNNAKPTAPICISTL